MHTQLINRLRLTAVTAAALLSLSSPTWAEPDSGSYLAARQAGLNGDFAAAANYFQNALAADPANLELLEQTLTAFVGTGQIDRAAELGKALIDAGGDSQVANIAIMAQSIRTQNWGEIFNQLEAGHEVGPLLDGLVQAWAFVGQGKMGRALDSFDEVADTPGMRSFGQHHKAMALTVIGDLEAADAIYSLPANQGLTPTRGTVLTHLQILCRLGDFDRAARLVDQVFSSDQAPEIMNVRRAIQDQEVPPLDSIISTPTHGAAFAFQGLADVLKTEASASYLLLYSQAARYIAPQDADNQLATARLLNDLEQYDAAAQTFAQVATDNDAFQRAEMGRADALRRAGRLDQAVEVLSQLTRTQPDQPMTYATLGDIYRQQRDFDNAQDAYNAALQGFSEDAPVRWWLLYSRGITSERLDQWDNAERDFRAALALNPENPSVLNYLGYSLVDRGMKYDEALGMIETAAQMRPNNGAIIDSLAWVYHKLERHEDAVAPMERAAELEPNDPIISDHLGDIYWMVGRETEAKFQWRRALSFGPEDDDAERIRRKLEIGLAAVNAEDSTDQSLVEIANDAN